MDGAFQTKILVLVDKARANKWTIDKFETELNKLLYDFGVDKTKFEKIKNELYSMLNNVNNLVVGIISKDAVEQMINYYKWKTIKTDESFRRKMIDIFQKHSNDLNYNELRNKIKSTIATKKFYEQTILNTTLAGIDNLTNIATKTANYQKNNPDKTPRFKYVGPPAERKFCSMHLNQIYTLQEINALDNGQGLPVITNGGGYNCRHHWVLVEI